MTDDALAPTLSRALLVLRITLGLFLLQWGVEKFVVPANTVGIWQYFYGLTVPQALGYLFGIAEIAIAFSAPALGPRRLRSDRLRRVGFTLRRGRSGRGYSGAPI
jgi:hypothetical protein